VIAVMRPGRRITAPRATQTTRLSDE
jgi:hypothetical protein